MSERAQDLLKFTFLLGLNVAWVLGICFALAPT